MIIKLKNNNKWIKWKKTPNISVEKRNQSTPKILRKNKKVEKRAIDYEIDLENDVVSIFYLCLMFRFYYYKEPVYCFLSVAMWRSIYVYFQIKTVWFLYMFEKV